MYVRQSRDSFYLMSSPARRGASSESDSHATGPAEPLQFFTVTKLYKVLQRLCHTKSLLRVSSLESTNLSNRCAKRSLGARPLGNYYNIAADDILKLAI
jgi:hypothetical protein